MTQGVLGNTLAALGYFIFSLFSQPNYYAFTYPVIFYPTEVEFVVSSQQTITDLAQQYYGSKDYWTNIWLDNPQINNPNVLPEGSKIIITLQKPLLVAKIPADKLASLLKNSIKASNKEDKTNFSAQITQVETLPSPSPILPTQGEPTNYDEIYKQAGEKYGVPWQILYGLHLTETGLRDGAIYNAQGSGAQGPLQFMPGTWNAYGVDGNGDGIADINNAVDAIHGAANYLAKHGGVEQGLRYYGGNTTGTLLAACEKGYCH